MATAPATPDSRPFGVALRADLGNLRRSPKDLWLIYVIKFLESVAYLYPLHEAGRTPPEPSVTVGA